jgi:uncharacterized protein
MARMANIADLLESAASGDEIAAFEVAMCYASGAAGAGVDLIQAHRWFNVALAWGHGEAQRCRAEIADEMSAREVVEAQKLARATIGGLMRQAA